MDAHVGLDLSAAIEIIGCHAAGEVGDVIVGGVAPPPGATLWDQARWLDADQELRRLVLNEPGGGVFRHVNLLVPPVHPDAAAGFLIMEPCHTPPMSGSNSMCVATVLLETGRVPMVEPVTEFLLEAPGGLVSIRARCENGKAVAITVRNLPSFVGRLDTPLDVPGLGRIVVDTAFGGDTFVMVRAGDLGLRVEPAAAHELAEIGARITAAATEQLGFDHPTRPDWAHISFAQIAEPLTRRDDGALEMRSTSVIEPGKLDRSPTGTGVSARLAVLHARGEIEAGQELVMRSVIGSEFRGRIVDLTAVGGQPGVVPEITGSAWITGVTHHVVDADDPWPTGYRLSDTWPGG